MGPARLLCVAVLAVGCAAPSPEPPLAPPSPTWVTEVQTWAKSNSTTDCADWKTLMTEPEKQVMAGELLLGLWMPLEPRAGLPSDSQVGSFSIAISSSCAQSAEGPDSQRYVTDIAAVVLDLDSRFEPPMFGSPFQP